MITRFAPSPTGPLHLGHAYSAMLAHDMARAVGGTFLLRIEDIDRDRSRAEWEALIAVDLHWLGLSWPEPVMRQSGRQRSYEAALDRLWQMGLIYPCVCTRRDIAQALDAPQEGGAAGPDGPVYPGTCRPTPRPNAGPHPDGALRLNMAAALNHLDCNGAQTLGFVETGPDPQSVLTRMTAAQIIRTCGDIVLARRRMGTSYHLSVVVDDAAQAITHVIRGADLGPATILHVVLQRLLDHPTPVYHHHALVRDDAGKRLAKRDDARALRLYRAEGLSPQDIRRRLSLPQAP